jgi:hypothetical protein
MVSAAASRIESYSLNLATLGITQEGELFQLILVEINGMGVQLDLYGQLTVRSRLVWGQESGTHRHRSLLVFLS